MIKVCSLDSSPPIAASSKGRGRSLSARAKALEPGVEPGSRDLVVASACLKDDGLLSVGENSPASCLLLCRRFRRMKKTRTAAMNAPAAAQPIPMPALAPGDMPLDEEPWLLAVVLEDVDVLVDSLEVLDV